MRKDVFEADSVEAAVEKAASKWQMDPEELDYEVLEEKTKKDFWGIEGTFYRVEVREAGAEQAAEREPAPEAAPPQAPARPPREEEPEAEEPETPPQPGEREEAPAPQPPEPAAVEEEEPRPEPEEPRPEPEEPRPEPEEPRPEREEPEPRPAGPEGLEATRVFTATGEEAKEIGVERQIEALLDRVFDAIDFDCEAEATEHDDTIHVLIGGEDKQYFLERKGRALSALQLLLNHAFRHREPAKGKKIRVDAGDYRARREEELQDLAFQVAHRAKETGSPQETQPMNPYERRLVHLALADDPAVSTQSKGSGFMKSVVVSPEK